MRARHSHDRDRRFGRRNVINLRLYVRPNAEKAGSPRTTSILPWASGYHRVTIPPRRDRLRTSSRASKSIDAYMVATLQLLPRQLSQQTCAERRSGATVRVADWLAVTRRHSVHSRHALIGHR